jgi:hypothetical protein
MLTRRLLTIGINLLMTNEPKSRIDSKYVSKDIKIKESIEL